MVRDRQGGKEVGVEKREKSSMMYKVKDNVDAQELIGMTGMEQEQEQEGGRGHQSHSLCGILTLS